MLAAIELDDEAAFDTGEIANVRAERVLASELEASELTATQSIPKQTLCIGWVFAEGSGEVDHLLSESGQYGVSVSTRATLACAYDPSAPSGHLYLSRAVLKETAVDDRSEA